MPNRSRRVASGLFAFAAIAAALTGGSANAQTDPFALPKTATAAAAAQQVTGPGPSEIAVDGRVKARMVELQGQGRAMTIDADHARAAGLPVPDGVSGQIALSSLKIYQWSFDSLRQRLEVTLLRQNDGANFHDFASRDSEASQRRTLAALRVDYDFTTTVNRAGLSAAGLVGAALVKGDVVAGTSARVSTAQAGQPFSATRLDSFIQTRLPGGKTVATLGDFISAGSASQRAVRMGGVQIASDFSHQPDLVTAPLPAFSGSVAVPTGIDILTADSRYSLGKVEPGEFTVRNIPTNPGRGSLAVLLKDSLGREVVRNVSFYVSNSLLRPGLATYAVNAGFVRRRYGVDSNDYGPFAASAYYRRGLSPFLTVEASAETTAGLVNVGSRADFTIGNVAMSSIELRASADAQAGSGAMMTASLESLGRGISGRIGVTVPTASYRDVASRLGDRLPPRQVFANLTFDLARKLPLQLAYVRQEAEFPVGNGQSGRMRGRDEVFRASIHHAPNSRLNFSIIGGMRAAETRSFFVSAGLTLRFGTRHSVGAGLVSGSDQTSATLAYQFNDHEKSRLRAQAALEMTDGAPRLSASAIHEGRWTTLQGATVFTDGQLAGQITTTGSLIAVGGSVYARSRSDNGFALVRAGGVAGVPVKLENQFVGKTDRSGKLLIHNMRTHIPQRIDVDGSGLPDDAVVLTSRHVITVPGRAIGVVDIDAMYFRPIVLQVVDARGAPLEAGLPVTAAPSGRETLVGYDGLVEFNAAGRDRQLIVNGPGGTCAVDVPATVVREAPAAPLVCRPTTTIAGVPSSPKVARRD